MILHALESNSLNWKLNSVLYYLVDLEYVTDVCNSVLSCKAELVIIHNIVQRINVVICTKHKTQFLPHMKS